MKKIIKSLLLFNLCYLLAVVPVKAQSPAPDPQPTPTPASVEQQTADLQSIKITAIPTRVELNGKPGETLQADLKVRNESEAQLAIEVTNKDFVVFDNQGTPIPINEELSGRWALSEWLTVSPQKILLNPNQIRELSLVISIPRDALPGGHYAMVTYSPLSQASLGQASTAHISQKVGTLIIITVDGPIKEDLKITEFEAKPAFAEYGPVAFKSELLNLSDVHVQPKGTIVITNMLKRISTMLPLEEINIFPFVSREYDNIWETKWGFGKYRAELSASYGSQGGVAKAVIYFWILPYRLIIAILLFIFFLFVARVVKKHRKLDEAGFNNLA